MNLQLHKVISDITGVTGLNIIRAIIGGERNPLFYTLWSKKESYVDPGADYYEQQDRERVVKNLRKKARSLGFELVEQPLGKFLTKPDNPLQLFKFLESQQ